MRIKHCMSTLPALLLICMVTILSVPSSAPGKTEKLTVVTTLFPLFDWAGIIGGEQAEVTLLLPPGIESHSFDPRPQDVVRINKSDMFIYTGKYMEPWAGDLLTGTINKDLLVIDGSQGIELMDEHHSDGHPFEWVGDDEHHSHGGKDPHIWLDFNNAEKMVDTIADGFIVRDPGNKELYETRAKEYKTRLQELDGRYKKALSQCKHRTIIYGGHFVFGYLAERFNLEHVSPYKGFAPNAEPTPRDIAELTKRIKEGGFKYIFYEEGIDPKVARVIGEETGAGKLLLHGAHNVSKDELSAKVSYYSLMNDNLARLQEGLECR